MDDNLVSSKLQIHICEDEIRVVRILEMVIVMLCE